MKTAAALVRVSTEIQTLESQIDALRSIAQSYGFEIPDRYVFQEKISGYDEDYYKDRRSIQELKSFIKTDKPSAIFIWELSRLSRRAVKISKYITELSTGPRIPMYFMDLDMWTIDPNTGNILDNNILEINANAKGCEMEREKIKSRTKRGRDLVASKGLYVGHLSDGYIANQNQEIVLDEDRIQVQITIFQLAQSGMSSGSIAQYLNEQNVPTFYQYRKNHPFWNIREETIGTTTWSKASVHDTLKNKWYAGVRTYNGREYPIPAILSIENWEKLQMRLKNSAIPNSKEPTTKHFYLLNGLLHCGICGKRLYGHHGGLHNHYYCSSFDSRHCGLRGINQDNIDAIVFKIMRLFFFNPDVERTTQTGQSGYLNNVFSSIVNRIEELGKEKEELEARKFTRERDLDDCSKRLAKITMTVINTDEKAAAYQTYKNLQTKTESEMERISKDINDLMGKIIQKEKQIGDAKNITNIQNIYDNLSVEEYRTLIRPLIEKITVYNADANTTVVKLDFSSIVNDSDSFTILYSPRLLKSSFIILSKTFTTSVLKSPNVSPLMLTFASHHLSTTTEAISYNEQRGTISINHEVRLLGNDNGVFLALETDIPTIKRELQRIGYDKDFSEHTDEIPMRLFIDMIRKPSTPWFGRNSVLSQASQAHIYKANGERDVRTVLIGYKRLLEPSEKAKRQYERWKIWEKENNTGKKTMEEYVVKDTTYDDIVQLRKRLYNRKYKIKNNKSLSAEEKKKQIAAIDLKLREFKQRINYIEGTFAAKKFKGKG